MGWQHASSALDQQEEEEREEEGCLSGQKRPGVRLAFEHIQGVQSSLLRPPRVECEARLIQLHGTKYPQPADWQAELQYSFPERVERGKH